MIFTHVSRGFFISLMVLWWVRRVSRKFTYGLSAAECVNDFETPSWFI
jgi:hypothetical protein